MKTVPAIFLALCAALVPVETRAQSEDSNNKDDAIVLPTMEIIAQKRDWKLIKTERIEFLTDMDSESMARSLAAELDMTMAFADCVWPLARESRETPVQIVFYNASLDKVSRKGTAFVLKTLGQKQMFVPGQRSFIRSYSKGVFSNADNSKWGVHSGVTHSFINGSMSMINTRHTYASSLMIENILGQDWWNSDSMKWGFWLNTIWNEMFQSFFHKNPGEANYSTLYTDAYRAILSIYGLPDDAFDNLPYKVKKAWSQGPFFSFDQIFTTKNPRLALNPGLGQWKQSIDLVSKAVTWERQCFDFGYYCLIAKADKYRNAWARFILASKYEPITEDLFRRCFGTGYKEFKKEIYDYLVKLPGNTSANGWGPMVLPIDITKYGWKPDQKLTLQSATRAESSRIFAEAMLLSRPALTTPERAYALLLKTAKDEPASLRDPDFLASLGLMEANLGDKDRAMELLEKATQAKVARAAAYRVLAQLRLEKLLAQKTSGGSGQLTAEETASVLAPLLYATTQRQSTGRIYQQMAEVFTHTPHEPPAAILKMIAAGCMNFPRDLDMLEAAIPLLVKYRMQAEVSKIPDNAFLWVFSPEAKEQYKKIIALAGRPEERPPNLEITVSPETKQSH